MTNVMSVMLVSLSCRHVKVNNTMYILQESYINATFIKLKLNLSYDNYRNFVKCAKDAYFVD